MGLFGKGQNDEKFARIEQLFKVIDSSKTNYDEMATKVDEFVALCKSLTDAEKKQFDKNVKKQSSKEKYSSQYEHAVYGRLYDNDNTADLLIGRVNLWKGRARKAKEINDEFQSIEDVNFFINPEGTLERHKLSEMPEIKIQNITKSFDIDAKLPTFVIIDLETTGLKPSSDRIVQICAMRYEQLEPTEAFVTYVNPGKHIPEEASEINNIFDDDVKDAPPLEAIAGSLLEFIGSSPIVGFSVSFDLQFLFCSGIDLISKRKIYDAKALAKKLYKKDIEYYSLDNVLAYHGMSIKEMHDAKVDCFATGMLFISMLKDITS